jgi:hypothetical protein
MTICTEWDTYDNYAPKMAAGAVDSGPNQTWSRRVVV